MGDWCAAHIGCAPHKGEGRSGDIRLAIPCTDDKLGGKANAAQQGERCPRRQVGLNHPLIRPYSAGGVARRLVALGRPVSRLNRLLQAGILAR